VVWSANVDMRYKSACVN